MARMKPVSFDERLTLVSATRNPAAASGADRTR